MRWLALGLWATVQRREASVRALVVPQSRWHVGIRGKARRAQHSDEGGSKRVVFLGSPGVAAKSLEALVAASKEGAGFEVCACVSQPPAKKGRKKVVQKSEVHEAAEALEIPCILTPASARDPEFIETLRGLEPDLCVTAAYGQFLPKAFLAVPKKGTWNIHPSLLPRWRGAAPLQRSLEAGDPIVGVSVLETVLKMDAGPIVRQVERPVEDDDDCDVLLEELFLTGTRLLVEALPDLWADQVEYIQQDEALVTHAAKIHSSEARLDLLAPSSDDRPVAKAAVHKLRAFTPWPGTWIPVLDARAREPVDEARAGDGQITLAPDGKALLAPCADGSILELLRVQPPSRKPMDAAAYWNGLRGEPIFIAPVVDDEESDQQK